MPDDKTKKGAQDQSRINVHEKYELRDWSKRLGVTTEELKKAVAQVGTSANAVRKDLRAEMSGCQSSGILPALVFRRVLHGPERFRQDIGECST